MSSKLWSDVDNTLKIDKRGNVVIKYNDDALSQAFKNIMGTISGERPRNTIGGNLINFIFEPVSKIVADDIIQSIRLNLERFDNRFQIINLQVEPDIENNGYWIRLTYRYRNSLTPVDIETFLNSMEM